MEDIKLKVKFMPMNVEHEIDFNETVLHLAQRHDIHIQSVCKGLPSCAECRICIQDGEHHVPPPSSKELSLIGTAHYIDRSRLACQLRCFGDITVDLSEQIEKQTRAAKQPQGRHTRKEGEVSHAVKGNLIESYTEDDDKSLAELIDTGARPGHDDFYKEKNNNQNRNNNQKKQQNNNNNQNRNNNHRNNNRNQQGANQGGQQGQSQQRQNRPQGQQNQGQQTHRQAHPPRNPQGNQGNNQRNNQNQNRNNNNRPDHRNQSRPNNNPQNAAPAAVKAEPIKND